MRTGLPLIATIFLFCCKKATGPAIRDLSPYTGKMTGTRLWSGLHLQHDPSLTPSATFHDTSWVISDIQYTIQTVNSAVAVNGMELTFTRIDSAANTVIFSRRDQFYENMDTLTYYTLYDSMTYHELFTHHGYYNATMVHTN